VSETAGTDFGLIISAGRQGRTIKGDEHLTISFIVFVLKATL
jgi:hypothetical protein